MESSERDSHLNVQLAAMFTAWNFVERRHARISLPEPALLFVSMNPFFVLKLIQISRLTSFQNTLMLSIYAIKWCCLQIELKQRIALQNTLISMDFCITIHMWIRARSHTYKNP